MNAPRTTEDAVNMLPVPTYLTAFTAPVILDTPVMALPAQVRQLFRQKLPGYITYVQFFSDAPVLSIRRNV